MRHVRRALMVATVTVVLIGSSVYGALAKPTGGSDRGRLRFTKPVALTSFAPLRTAVGAVYSITRGQMPSDHEWSGEPVIKVDDKGVIYIAGTCCVVAATPVWYSTNGGKTFEELETSGHVREYTIGAEGDLAVDDEGRIYFVDTFIPGLMFTRWSEHGGSWDFTMPAAGVIPGFDDRPWIAWSKPALYLYINHVSHTQIYRSEDAGLTWQTNGPLTWKGSALGQPYFPGHVAAHEKSGTVWVAGVVGDDGKDVIGSAVSTDMGATFTEAVVTAPQGKGGFSPVFTGITTVDAAGNGYVSWSTFDEKGCDVYFAGSTDKGKSWGEPVKVNDGGGCATFPWIDAGADGRLAVVWYQTPYAKEVPNGYQNNVPEKAPWYLHAAVVLNATGRSPTVFEARVPTKTPVMQGPLQRELWDFLQVDEGPDGRMHITYSVKYKDSAPQTWYVGSTGGPRLR